MANEHKIIAKELQKEFPALAWDQLFADWQRTRPAKAEKPLASYIEHTLLKPSAGSKDIELLCREAIEFKMLGVCLNQCRIAAAKKLLQKTEPKLISVIDFPLGAATKESKLEQAKRAIAAGADEIDMVLNRGLLTDNRFDLLVEEILLISQNIEGKKLKVIIESGRLNKREKISACLAAALGKASFVKTSTGFLASGATVADLELIAKSLPPSLGVKASGGIDSYDKARAMIKAGANRLGCSRSLKILAEERKEQ